MSFNDQTNPQVFWVQNKPFPKELRNSEQAICFQEECLEKRLFGMGWKSPKFNNFAGSSYNSIISDELKHKVKEAAFTRSQNIFGKMNEGDVVLTKLNGKYYAGKISFKPKFSSRKELTWYSEVDKWVPLGLRADLPHHLCGKLSSVKYHGTAEIIDGLSAFTIMEIVGVKITNKPKVNEVNYLKTLGDEDLEDLLAHYMLENNEGFIFLPSSCKKNTPGIEYIMYHPISNELIACQTKVNREIDVSEYLYEHCFEQYKTLYLFSGKGYSNNNSNDLKNIKIINNNDLYQIFKNNKHFTDIVEKYFEIE